MWLGGGTSSDSAPTWDRGKARRAQGSPVTSCSSNKGGNGAEGSPLPHQGASGSLGLEFPPQPPTSHPHPKPLLSFKPCFTHPSSRWASPPPRSWHFLIYRGGVGVSFHAALDSSSLGRGCSWHQLGTHQDRMARSLFLPRHPHSGAGSCGEVTVTAGVLLPSEGPGPAKHSGNKGSGGPRGVGASLSSPSCLTDGGRAGRNEPV